MLEIIRRLMGAGEGQPVKNIADRLASHHLLLSFIHSFKKRFIKYPVPDDFKGPGASTLG